MSRFALEALFIGVKEGVKLSVCVFLVLTCLKSARLDTLKKPLTAGLLLVFLASFIVMTAPVTLEVRDIIVRMIGYVFGLFYFFSLAALFHETGADMLGPLKSVVAGRAFLAPLGFLLTVLYFVPDMAGSSLYVADLSSMAGGSPAVFAAAGAGFALSLSGAYGAARVVRADLSRLFGLPQALLALALIKLIAGGVRGFAELSLIPSVQAGLMKLIHDVVHQTFVFLMVPDHPILSTTAWNFIGVLFGESMGLWISLILLVLPLVLFIRKHFGEEVSVPTDISVPARKRTFIKSIRDLRVQKSIPVFLFMVVIMAIWFVQKGESVGSLHIPEPRPVAAEGGRIVIPLQTPPGELRDGAIHKFSLAVGGDEVRVLIMKKPDGTLAVCLDACEICPPDGYGQAREHVVCLYCKTPIPFDTVGKPGGCNPIPLAALVTDKDVQIALEEVAQQWTLVKTGKTKEGLEK